MEFGTMFSEFSKLNVVILNKKAMDPALKLNIGFGKVFSEFGKFNLVVKGTSSSFNKFIEFN